LDYLKTATDNLLDLLTTFEVEAAIRLLLVNHEDVGAILPNAGNLHLLAGETLPLIGEAQVLAGTASLHQLVLAELW
jgi:hypothetical protein